MDVFEQQEKLQQESDLVLERLDLINFLSNFGQPKIVGSKALKLMTWKDIDISILGITEEDKYWEVVKYLFHKPHVIDLSEQDTRRNTDKNLTTGLYISVRYFLGDETSPWELVKLKPEAWKIDIWFVDPKSTVVDEKMSWIKNSLTEEKRKIILEIKNNLKDNSFFRKKFSSMDVYNAVLDKRITNIEEFNKYLKEIGKI